MRGASLQPRGNTTKLRDKSVRYQYLCKWVKCKKANRRGICVCDLKIVLPNTLVVSGAKQQSGRQHEARALPLPDFDIAVVNFEHDIAVLKGTVQAQWGLGFCCCCRKNVYELTIYGRTLCM